MTRNISTTIPVKLSAEENETDESTSNGITNNNDTLRRILSSSRFFHEC